MNVNVYHVIGLLLVAGEGLYAESLPTVTLTAARSLAQAYPEFIEPDNHDLVIPSFSSWYRQQKPWYITTLFEKFIPLTNSKKDIADITSLRLLAKGVIAQRHNAGWAPNQVAKITYQPQDKLVIFGDIQGGFHSFVRCLSELERQGIIDNDLVIKKSDYRIIFNSNIIGKTPYNLQVMAVLLSLMAKNPEKVLCTRGRHEESDYWVKYTLHEQLYLFDEADIHKNDSLANLLEGFFLTLPFALYIEYHNHGVDLVRISGYERDFEKINEKLLGDFWANSSEKLLTKYDLSQQKKSTSEVHVRALIASFRSFETFVNNDGLLLVDYAGGATVWSVFSSPILLYQKFADFHYDAFAIVELQEQLAWATISLYNRDMSDPGSVFKFRRRYALLSGQELGPLESVAKKHEQSITVGSSCDLSKGSSIAGHGIKDGIFTYINACNREGGIRGRDIKLIMRDHGYEPARAHDDAEYFYAVEKTRLILVPSGSQTLYAMLDVIKTNSMLVMFPSTGSMKFRSPDLLGLLHFRASYRDEMFALLPFMIAKRFVKRFAFFYQNDEYGQSSMAVARELLPKYGITSWTELPYMRNVTDFKLLVDELKKAQPEALGLFSISAATEEFLRQLGVHVVMNIKLFGLDPLVDGVFDKFIKKLGLRCVFSKVVPDPLKSTLPIVQEYRKVMDAAGIAYSDLSLEGFVGANLMVYGMKNVTETISPETLRGFFEKLNNVSFKGLQLTFDPKTRSLNKDVWLDTGDGNVIRISDPEEQYKKGLQKK